MHIINITVRDKIATHVGDAYYVCGNSDFVVHFDFDEEWDALDVKTARFIRQDGVYYDKVFSGSECPVPIISNTNDVRVGVFAGNLCTTTPARVPAAKSILCPAGVPAAPGEDVYNQIMQEVNETRGAAEENAKGLEAARGEIPDVLIVKLGAGNVSSHSQQEVKDAYFKGKTGKAVLMVDLMGRVFSMTGVKDGVPIFHHTSATKLPADAPRANALLVHEAKLNADGTFSVGSPNYSTTPNPYKLTIKQGDTSMTYDGSSAVTVEVEGGEAVQADMAQSGVTAPDYVKNRTHYDLPARSYPAGMQIPEGAAAAQLMQDGAASGWRMVKVSDVTPAAADLAENAYCQVCTGSTTGRKVTAENIAGETPAGYIVASVARLGSGNVYQIRAVVCFEAGYVAEGALSVNIKGLTATLPEPGLYMLAKDGEAVTYGGLTWQGHTHVLADRFIPSTVLRKAELPDMPTDEHIRGLADERLSLFGQAVCLPETVKEDGSNLVLEAPWTVEIQANRMYNILYNGKLYRYPAVSVPGSPVGLVVLGNGQDAEMPDLNPDAPFAVTAVSNSVGAQIGQYGAIAFLDDSRPFTISIYEASSKGYYYYDGTTARLVGIKELRQALFDAGKPVTILEGTTVQGEGGQMLLLIPLAADPEVGAIYKVTYNGTAYDCPVLAYAADGMTGVMLGNSDALGVPGGNPDAPFVALLMPGGTDMGDGLMAYGMVIDTTGASSATISIVEAASGPEYMTREQVVELINEMMGGN